MAWGSARGAGPGVGDGSSRHGGGGSGPSSLLLGPLLSPAPVVLEAPSAVGVWAACLAMTLLFVLTLYLLPAPIRQRPRDDPVHIRARFVSVATACLLTTRIFLRFTRPAAASGGREEGGDAHPPLRWLGLTVAGVLANPVPYLLPLVAVLLLFLGPLCVLATEIYLDRWYDIYTVQDRPVIKRRPFPTPPTWREMAEQRMRRYGQTMDTLLRNLLVAPVTEEVVFRACMLPLLHAHYGPARNAAVVLASPVLFGVAHLHHGWQRVARDGVPIGAALLGVLLQFSYTAVFGWFAGFVFLRTAHALPCVLAHAFCNLMGLPNLAFLLPPSRRAGAYLSPSAVLLHRHRLVFAAIYLLGIGLFAKGLFPLTDPARFVHGGKPLYWR